MAQKNERTCTWPAPVVAVMLRRKPPFPPDYELFTSTHFPYPESQIYEFKKSLQHYDKKILGTICAFLNSQGGYFVFGIDDETLEITGVRNDRKSVDTFLIDIDSIFHLSRIVDTTTMDAVQRENIVLSRIEHPRGTILVIDVSPIIGHRYQLSDGTSYERLNASNLMKKVTRLYTEEEMMNIIRNKEDKLRNRYEKYIESLKKKFARAHAELQDI
jgi:predicted HTH transcriptional regulator